MSEIDIKYKIWFYLLKLSNDEKIKLLNMYENELNIYNKFEEIINTNSELNNKNYLYNKEHELNKNLSLIRYMLKNEIYFLTYNDEDFPEKLKNINNCPYALFYKGNVKLLKSKTVAIVGARNCTNYGMEVTKLLTKNLISYNITIISGGARGIDTCAHKNTILNKGNTIVVLGCGIDVVYPKENCSLFNEVCKNGLIISEFLPKTPPYKYNFPTRNRLISGLSDLVIVIEASEKSGSLITATYAADQSREVMVVPGNVFSDKSKGCNKLIREGAAILTSFSDVAFQLKLNSENTNNKVNKEFDKILQLIKESPMHIDEIARKSFIDRDTLFKVLFEMQIKKEIVSLPGNYYAKII